MRFSKVSRGGYVKPFNIFMYPLFTNFMLSLTVPLIFVLEMKLF
jgi:hypothetical protein